jgi:hypothetical protein
MISHLKVIAIIGALEFPAFAVALGLPIWRIATTGRLWSSFFRMWLYMVLWAIVFCFALPVLLAYVFNEQRAYDYFPTVRGVVPMILIGWLPCMIICFVAWLIHIFWIQPRSRPKSN